MLRQAESVCLGWHGQMLPWMDSGLTVTGASIAIDIHLADCDGYFILPRRVPAPSAD